MTKLNLIVLISAAAALIALIILAQTQQQAEAQTGATTTNFTKQLSDKFSAEQSKLLYTGEYLTVAYESPKTIVLVGRQLAVQLIPAYSVYNNQIPWKGVDFLKQNGFIIDFITISGLGTMQNPSFYHIVLSHK
jgi:hypothetical protein